MAKGRLGCPVSHPERHDTPNESSVKIGSVVKNANGAGITVDAALKDAYRKAAEKAFPALLERVTDAWQAERTTGRLVRIEVHAAEMSDLTGFKRRLGRMFGVDKVELKGFKPGR